MRNFCLWATLLTIVVALTFSGVEPALAKVEISGDALVRTRLRIHDNKAADKTQTNSYNIYRFGVNVKAPISDNATLGCRLSSESPVNFITMGNGVENLPEITFQYAYLKWKIQDKITFTGGRFPYNGGFLADMHFNPTSAAALGLVDSYFLVFHANALEGFMVSAPLVKGDTGVGIELAISPDTERGGSIGDVTEHDTYDCILAAPITAMEGKLNLRPSVSVRTTADENALDSIGNIRITGGASGSFALSKMLAVGFGAGYSMISTDNFDNNTIAFTVGPSVKGLGPGNLGLRFDMAMYSDGNNEDNNMINPFAKVNYLIPFKDRVALEFRYRMYMKKTDDEVTNWMRNQFDVTLKARF